ncbi:uncharacterized protein LOC131650230 [Vicia villosa]|uniref:uncharacterized protein LOC131650230 n=1 Tax=Vicia villosa TaxID=3911 RepID=UPI00273C1CE9|nr:uncharacterized protein LOC131650230 [Vicia villosa]
MNLSSNLLGTELASCAHMEHFSYASSYSHHLKSLFDQLSNVEAPVSNELLSLQIISGLTNAYTTVGSQIRHGDPLPPFYKARSRIILEETASAEKAVNTTNNVAFIASHIDASAPTSSNRAI